MRVYRGHKRSAGIPGLAMAVIEHATQDMRRPHRHEGPRAIKPACRRCEAVAFLTGSTPAWRAARTTFFAAAGLTVPAQSVITNLVDGVEGAE